jgi:hypothetical protein
MYKISVIFLLLVMTGCASLTPAGEKLKIVNKEEEVIHCQAVGKVRASSSISSDAGWGMISSRNAKVQMKNMAAEMGDTLLITEDSGSIVTGTTRSGTVFRCNKNIDSTLTQ